MMLVFRSSASVLVWTVFIQFFDGLVILDVSGYRIMQGDKMYKEIDVKVLR